MQGRILPDALKMSDRYGRHRRYSLKELSYVEIIAYYSSSVNTLAKRIFGTYEILSDMMDFVSPSIRNSLKK